MNINIDCILALKKKDNGNLWVDIVDIPHTEDILLKLDSFEDGNYYDIFDVINYVEGLNIDNKAKYSYCWYHEYNASFIDNATIEPQIFMYNRTVKITFDKEWKSIYDDDIRSVKNRVEVEYSAKRSPKRRMERTEYLSYLAKLDKEMLEEIEKQQRERRAEIKNEYVRKIRRCIYAMDYYKALPSVKTSSLMYFSENIGWYRPDYTITDNVQISVRTNFCYGRSAYFHVNLNYKGINILPYSDIVVYF